MLRIHSFFKTDFGTALILAVCWQLIMTLIGFIAASHQGFFGHMDQWDAGWYKHIIEYGYALQGNPAAPAFYPLFPLIINILSTLTFHVFDVRLLVLVINTLALWFILVALMRIVAKFSTSKAAQRIAVLAFLSFPSAFFLHVFYGESLFIAIAFWAYLSALNKKWWLVGILLGILTAARLPSLLFIGLCILEYIRSYDWNIKKALNKNILWFLIAPVGFISYGFYLLAVRGDFLAMFHAYSATNDWTYQVFNLNIFATLYNTVAKIIQSATSLHPTYEVFINYALPLACVLVLIISSVYILVKLGSKAIPLFVFGILAIVMFTLNSNVVSVHRYILGCLPIFIAVTLLGRQKLQRYLIITACLLSVLIQLFIYIKFANGIFAG